MLALRRALVGEPARFGVQPAVQRIDAQVHAFALVLGQRTPTSSLGARFALPHLLAVAWLHGHADAHALGARHLNDPLVAALRDKVVLSERKPLLAPPHERAARVGVLLADGRQPWAECLSASGSPAQPFPREQLLARWRDLAGGRYPAWFDALGQVPQCLDGLGAVPVREVLGG